MKKLISLLILSAAFAQGVPTTAAAQPLPDRADQRKRQFNTAKDGLAIQGYDPVAYFTAQKAVEGRKDQSVTLENITYRFSTSQNKALFLTNPSKYEPQYGGWCAYAMGSSGEKVEIDPATFKLIDGKLYLFYNRFFNNTLKSWNKDESHLKAQADLNWQKINH